MTAYSRPEITSTEQNKLARLVMRFFVLPRPQQIKLLAKIASENMLLAREVNDHRAALGLDPIPTYEP
jgi:hypothetical protein